jgi:hypothetical protein
VLTEIGGTVGDIEILPFEAIRQFRKDAGRETYRMRTSRWCRSSGCPATEDRHAALSRAARPASSPDARLAVPTARS